jgi:alcohol dehydrogenase
MDDETGTPSVFLAIQPQRVTHGPGCARGLAGAIGRCGGQRVLVVTGPSVAEATGLLWYVEQLLGPLHAGSYTGVRPHTPEETVAEAAVFAEEASADCLVSLGGGSAIDTAKAAAHQLSERRGAPPPQVALPTTLSAAEFTYYAGVTGADRIKRRIAAPALVPREVFLDPTLTLETAPVLWLSSGIKALDHALESLLNPRHHPVTDALALEAAATLFDALPACARDPTSPAPRGRAQVGAWMSLFSPATARGGLSHALGHQLGARGVPHGITSCITLPVVLRFLEPATRDRQQEIAGRLGLTRPLADAVADLVLRLELPARLAETSLTKRELPAIAAATLKEAQAVSPAAVDEQALRRLLEEMW